MIATLQVTRAPWVERPIITRSILSAVGVAFALDSYDPVEREAFPIAFQVGGFVQDLGEERLGQGREKAREALRGNPALSEDIQRAVLADLGIERDLGVEEAETKAA